MTMTETKLQKLAYNERMQKQSGWYLSRVNAIPAMTSHGIFNRVVRVQGYRCIMCNTVSPHLSVDHIKPRSRGGGHNIENLRLLCLYPCHHVKDNLPRKVKLKKIPIFQFPIR